MRVVLKRTLVLVAMLTWFGAILLESAKVQGQSAIPIDSTDTRIPRNSKVYMAPMDGFEQYLAAAFRKKSVLLLIIVDRDQADFEITGTHEKTESLWSNTIFFRTPPSVSASIQIVNMKTRVVVFADSSFRLSAFRGERSTAEKLAKYLKRKMEKDERKQ